MFDLHNSMRYHFFNNEEKVNFMAEDFKDLQLLFLSFETK